MDRPSISSSLRFTFPQFLNQVPGSHPRDSEHLQQATVDSTRQGLIRAVRSILCVRIGGI